jgi:SH3 domain-containing YSC84-like protein 1
LFPLPEGVSLKAGNQRGRTVLSRPESSTKKAEQFAGASKINSSFHNQIEAAIPKEQYRMKKLIVFLLMGCLGNLAWAGEQKKDVTERLQMATDVLNQLVSAPDKGIPEEVLDSARCIAVVPHLVKGGFILGGKHGRGVATCRTADGWSAPAFISVGGGSAGLQIGVEGVDLVMLIMNEKGMQQLLSSKFQLSGEGSAAAGPVGRHASAGTDWKMQTEMLTYSRSQGVFAGLTLEGAVVQQDSDSTTSVYGHDVSFKSVLQGKVSTPDIAKAFMKAVADAAHKARVQEALDEKR